MIVCFTGHQKLGLIQFDYKDICFLLLIEDMLFSHFIISYRSIEVRINLIPRIMIRNHKNHIFSRAYHINIARQDTK